MADEIDLPAQALEELPKSHQRAPSPQRVNLASLCISFSSLGVLSKDSSSKCSLTIPMAKFTDEQLHHLARLCRIETTEQDRVDLAEKLQRILSYMER